MKKLFCTLAVIGLSLPVFAADVPSPDRLLPADTLGVLTIPDMAGFADHVCVRAQPIKMVKTFL
jgi:hypothetical protein